MTVAGASGSNYLVSTDNLASSFIELLRNRSVAMTMGATRLSGLVGNVTIPRQTAAGTAYWLASESTDITESQPTLGQLSLSAKNVAALTEISEQMMRQSSPDAEQLVMSDLAKVIALAVDVAIIRGSGNSGQPQGIVGTSGVATLASGSSVDYADILEFQSDIAANNALVAGCGYVTTPAIAALLATRSRFSNTDTPLWEGNILDGRMAGFRAMSSNQMSSATMLFGDWSQVILGEWGVLEIATHATDFAKGLTGIRAWYSCDVGVRVPGAFCYGSSIT
jgi:HK97 family phage major capsid protein